mmetsp:Transcript_51988/g.103461  ORF Transcript_51988/g.103461 Transcript_51988/m.103461 type:complete len:250 (-) Transcript_51988:1016-1765(-)
MRRLHRPLIPPLRGLSALSVAAATQTLRRASRNPCRLDASPPFLPASLPRLIRTSLCLPTSRRVRRPRCSRTQALTGAPSLTTREAWLLLRATHRPSSTPTCPRSCASRPVGSGTWLCRASYPPRPPPTWPRGQRSRRRSPAAQSIEPRCLVPMRRMVTVMRRARRRECSVPSVTPTSSLRRRRSCVGATTPSAARASSTGRCRRRSALCARQHSLICGSIATSTGPTTIISSRRASTCCTRRSGSKRR